MGRFGQERNRLADRLCGKHRKRCRAILQAEARCGSCREIGPVERFRRGCIKKGIRQESFENTLVNLAGRRKTTVLIEIQSLLCTHPVVDKGIPRAGIEGQKMVEDVVRSRIGPRADPGQVGNPTDIQETNRPVFRGQHRMIQRREGRALTARRNVSGTKIVNHIDTEHVRKGLSIPDLDGFPLGRLMEHGVSMEPDHINVAGIQPGAGQQFLHGLAVQGCQMAGKIGRSMFAAKRTAQGGPEFGLIRQ